MLIVHPIADTAQTGNQLYVLREDLLPFGFGGNKVRITDAYFEDFRRKECSVMVAYGNEHSNLCRVIANRCCQEKTPCYILYSYDYLQAPGRSKQPVSSNAKLTALFGANIVPCNKADISSSVEALLTRLERSGEKPYYIYGNKYGVGNEGVPATAYASRYSEILKHSSMEHSSFDYIFLASGTGSTQAGLICGHILAEDACQVIGILISSREYERAVSVIHEGIRQCLPLMGKSPATSYLDEIHLETEYTCGGYGIAGPEIYQCISEQLCANGLPLDPCYTGKAFYGMQQYLKKNHIQNKRVLFIHTGGTPLFFDCLNQGLLKG